MRVIESLLQRREKVVQFFWSLSKWRTFLELSKWRTFSKLSKWRTFALSKWRIFRLSHVTWLMSKEILYRSPQLRQLPLREIQPSTFVTRLYSRTVHFQINEGCQIEFFYLDKLTKTRIYGKKDYKCRKMRITNGLFGVDSPYKNHSCNNFIHWL